MTDLDALKRGAEDYLNHVKEFGATSAALMHEPARLIQRLLPALEDASKYRALNTPEIHDFMIAVEREALHQRDRWGVDHDAGKADSDWYWLLSYLAGKALHKPEKALHHIITTAAACLNWHAAKLGAHNKMRPGIDGDSAMEKADGK